MTELLAGRIIPANQTLCGNATQISNSTDQNVTDLVNVTDFGNFTFCNDTVYPSYMDKILGLAQVSYLKFLRVL